MGCWYVGLGARTITRRTFECYSLRPRSLKDLGPFVRVVELCSEVRSEVSIGEVRRIVLFHELHHLRVGWYTLPPIPEPFRGETGNGEYAPVNEDSQFAFVVPRRQRSGVDGFPGGFIGDAMTESRQRQEA